MDRCIHFWIHKLFLHLKITTNTVFMALSRYRTYTDVLSVEEEEEINRERIIKEKAFSILADREKELQQICKGELTSKKKPKSTAKTKRFAFMQYMKMFYDKPRPTVRTCKLCSYKICEYFDS